MVQAPKAPVVLVVTIPAILNFIIMDLSVRKMQKKRRKAVFIGTDFIGVWISILCILVTLRLENISIEVVRIGLQGAEEAFYAIRVWEILGGGLRPENKNLANVLLGV